MDIEKVVAALAEYGREMAESDPTAQELRAEIERLKQELSDSTNHYNGIINDLVKLRDEARAEVQRFKEENDDILTAAARDGALMSSEYRRLEIELRERDETIVRLKDALRDSTETSQEPSRLEIAAMLYKGMLSSGYIWGDPEKTAIRSADALIAAAKEVAK
jgi:uncharacterized coiled-coil DUF342 family protein